MSGVDKIAAILGILAGLVNIWAGLSDKGRYRLVVRFAPVMSWGVSAVYILLLTVGSLSAMFNVRLLDKMPQLVHVMGTLLTLSVIVSLVLERIKRWKDEKAKPNSTEALCQNSREEVTRQNDVKPDKNPLGDESCLGKDEMQKLMVERSVNADEVIVLAGKGVFLEKTGDNTDSVQFEEIRKDATKFKILLDDNKENERITDRLHVLREAGAEIKAYPQRGAESAVRGRILFSGGVYSAVLCRKHGSEKFDVLELNDSNLAQLIYKTFKKMMEERGTNIFIKYVCFDLAGVYFSGNIRAFYDKLKKMGIPIDVMDHDHLCVGDEVNLNPNFTIIHHLKTRFGDDRKVLNIIEKKENDIIAAWNTTWTINADIQEIANKLKGQGYKIAICSNCDGLNGNKYRLDRAFQGFDTFLSYEIKKLKPNKEYFDFILDKYRCFPYEVLFIDDHEKNTEQAASMGFETILVINRDCSNVEKAKFITTELEKISIRIND
jgi:HAD superfamily hydrolase (TIGR01509 family)